MAAMNLHIQQGIEHTKPRKAASFLPRFRTENPSVDSSILSWPTINQGFREEAFFNFVHICTQFCFNAASKIILIILMFLLLSGCAAHYFDPVCRHKAIYAAITAGEKYPVKIMRGPVKGDELARHVQAIAIIDGKTHWLVVVGGQVQTGKQDSWFTPIEELSVEEFLFSEFRYDLRGMESKRIYGIEFITKEPAEKKKLEEKRNSDKK